MKRHLFPLLFILCCTSFQEMRANPITRNEAVQRVRVFFGDIIGKEQLTIVQNQSRRASRRLNQQTEPYYVLSRGTNKGFIIASGDDKIVPVLGYTDIGDFDYEKLPLNLQEWLEDYEKQIEYIQQLPAKESMTITSSHPEVPILLTCNWDQGYPFNSECPFDHNRDQCVTGCIATAMAQILYYHRERSANAVTKAIPVYHTGEFYVDGIPQGAPIDWDNMIDNYPFAINYEFDENGYREETIDNFTEEQKKAVAQLMLYCGVSVKMKYSSRGSSAMHSDVANAFKQYFGYYETTQHVFRSNYLPAEWDAMIYNDISQGFPVYLSGSNVGGGHAFVCDGYDGKGYYHINWGWGGYCDGYFLLNNLAPKSQGIGGSDGGYNDNQEAVIGIVPASIMPISFNNSITEKKCVSNWDTDGDKKLSYDEAAAVTDLGTVFAGTRITSFDEIRFFSSITAISDDAFSKCSQLSSITIPDNVGRIGQNAFLDCKSLKSVSLPNSIISIGNNAFSGCKLIATLEMPESICEIGSGAFEGCTKLSSLTILKPDPSSITLGNDVFLGIDLNSATLYVLEGTKSFYESASQWNSFGVIKEIRTNSSENYDVAMELKKLLEIAQSKNINVEREQSVFDNLQSSEAEILQAQRTLRKKLGFISFADQKVKNIIQSLWDFNSDGELTKTELANINDYDIVGVFRDTDIISFEEFKYFTGLSCVPDSCFYNCNKLQVIKVPENVEWVGNDAFNGCSSLSCIELPSLTRLICNGCFKGCTSLVEFYSYSPTPPQAQFGLQPFRVENVFGIFDLSKTTLYVPRGTKELYGDEALWNKFGEINEMRTVSLPAPIPLSLDERVYIYNVGKHQFINKGEAWGTQAVISSEGLVYKVKRNSTMPKGLYYLEAENIGTTNKILYRTDQDSRVGIGNKACFVDGTLTKNAYWHIIQQDDGTYKIQVPQNSQDYVENEYLGFSNYNNSDYYFDSKGLYYNCDDDMEWDEKLSDWSFIRVEDYEKMKENETLAGVLGELICKAKEKNIDVTSEEMVYEKKESTIEEINNSLLSIRNKLQYINFLDVNTKKAFIDRWDLDEDEELSIEEAEAVVSIGQTFRSNKNLIELDELKYFTSIKEIEPNAFREMESLQSIYIPSNVTQIGESAFSQCNNLRYVAFLNDKIVTKSDMSAISGNVVLFVPANLKLNYQTNGYWKEKGNDITEYTGQPVVTAIGSREYGLSTKFFKMRVEGAPILGEAEMYLNEDIVNTTPIGDYPIVVKIGNIKNHNVILQDGTFKVTPAPLTITANSYTRKVGEPNPQFDVTYSRFRNRETEEVLTVKPILTCSATIDSPAGEYEIMVSDAEANNYIITYLPGILTIDDTDGIADVNGGHSNINDIPTYNLLGRRVLTKNKKPGLYIVKGKKYVQR